MKITDVKVGDKVILLSWQDFYGGVSIQTVTVERILATKIDFRYGPTLSLRWNVEKDGSIIREQGRDRYYCPNPVLPNSEEHLRALAVHRREEVRKAALHQVTTLGPRLTQASPENLREAATALQKYADTLEEGAPA